MAQLIPIFLVTSSDFAEELELNSELVTIRLAWNVRNDTAHMDFTDPDGNTVSGVKVVPNWPLLRQIKGSIEFDGDLMVIQDDANASTEITYENLGNGQNLYYLDTAEVIDWEEANGTR